MKDVVIRALLDRGAHLVPCGTNKAAIRPGWQETRWDGQSDHALVGVIPGSLGYAVCDVDLPAELKGQDTEAAKAEAYRRRDRVIELIGLPEFTVPTPSGGAHLFYPLEQNGGVVGNGAYTWGDIRVDRGYVIVYDATPLNNPSDSPRRIGRGEFLRRLAPTLRKAQRKASHRDTPRLDPEGERNTDLYNRVVAAVANDDDPEPAIIRARMRAVNSGLPASEVDATIASARRAGGTQRKQASHRDTPAEKTAAPPLMTDELAEAMRLMEANDPAALPALRRAAAAESWTVLTRDQRGLLLNWVRIAAPSVFRPSVMATLGTISPRSGVYQTPPPHVEEDTNDEPRTLASLSDDSPVCLAHGLAFRGRLGLFHGPAGQGKTTLFANLASRMTTGREFAGRPCAEGRVLILTEDPYTWRHVVTETEGNPERVLTTRWPIPDRHVAGDVVLVVVDTMAYVSNIEGINLDKAHEVDRVLRPLSELAAEFNVAVLVLDHEPWSNEQGKQGKTAERPRHSGAKVGTCDWLARVEMDRDRGGVKVTRGLKSRVGIEIPAEIWYDARGDAIDGADLPAADPEANDWALEYLTPVAATVSELIRRKGETPNGALSKKLRDALTALADEDGLVQRVAKDGLKPEGVKGNPWMYYVKEE